MLQSKAFMDSRARIDAGIPGTLQLSSSADHESQRAPWELLVDVRSASMGLLAVLATLYTLYWAKDVFIPVLMGLMASYALTPLVDQLERWRLPRVLASALVMVTLVCGIGLTSYRLSDDAGELIASLPEVAQKFRQTLQKTEPGQAKRETTIDKVQQAATELEKTADGGTTAAGGPRTQGVTRVQIEKPKFKVQDYFWTGTLGLVTLAGQATVVLFLTFFLLSSGNTFRRKMVKIAGPTFASRHLKKVPTRLPADELSLRAEAAERLQGCGGLRRRWLASRSSRHPSLSVF